MSFVCLKTSNCLTNPYYFFSSMRSVLASESQHYSDNCHPVITPLNENTDQGRNLSGLEIWIAEHHSKAEFCRHPDSIQIHILLYCHGYLVFSSTVEWKMFCLKLTSNESNPFGFSYNLSYSLECHNSYLSFWVAFCQAFSVSLFG